MVASLEQAAAAAFLNNVMGNLFQALGLVETYKMLRDLKPESESLLQDLRMLAAAVDDELTSSRGARRTAVARAYSSEMRALTHDVEDCVERFVHRVTGGGGLEGASRLRRAAHTVWTLRTCYRFAAEIKRLKKRVQEVSARVLKPLEGGAGGVGQQPSGSRSAATRRAADHAARHPVGIERPVEELLALLGLDQVADRPQPPALEQPRVISIVGFGGVGKTTLARAVYDAAAVVDAFPCRAWVAVRSPEDGDAAGILESIYHQLLPGQQFSESSLTKYLKDKRAGLAAGLTQELYGVWSSSATPAMGVGMSGGGIVDVKLDGVDAKLDSIIDEQAAPGVAVAVAGDHLLQYLRLIIIY